MSATPIRNGSSSTKKRKGSPVKKQASKMSAQLDTSNLTPTNVEIEHLQTTIITLNTRVEIIEDMEREVESTRGALDNSDEQRAKLQ